MAAVQTKTLHLLVTLSPAHVAFWVALLPRQDTGISYQNLQIYPIINPRKVKNCLALRLAAPRMTHTQYVYSSANSSTDQEAISQ